MAKKEQKSTVIIIRVSDDFKSFVKTKADEKGIDVSEFIRLVVAKHTGYTPKEIEI